MATAPGLTFGSLNFIGTDAELAANGYRFEALGDDTDWENPVPVEEKVISWLQDGSIVALKNYDNREMNIRVRIKGADLNKLALGESALMLETGKPNLLTWTPPDAFAAPCVFSVITSSLEFAFEDLSENKDERTYALRIVAEPFVRAQALTTVVKAAPTGTQTITNIDNGSATTNWAGVKQVGLAAAAATVVSTGSGLVSTIATALSTTDATRLTLTRSALAVGVSTTPYIRVILQVIQNAGAAYANGTTGPSFKLNGIAAPVVLQTGTSYWLDASAAGVVTLNSVEATIYGVGIGGTTASQVIAIDSVDRSNYLGIQGTGRQLLRTLPVAGSARAQGNLAIEDASAALGTALVYTYPAGAGIVSPNLRDWISAAAAGPVSDAASVSGFTTDISTSSSLEFEVPVTGIQPGGHVFLARMKSTTSGTKSLSWSINGKQGSSTFGPSDGGVFGTTTWTAVLNVWQIVTVCSVNLPVIKMGSSGKLNLSIGCSGSGLVVIDEGWLFNIETGDLTWVEAGTASPSAGGSSNRLWLDAPSVQSPVPAAYVGFASDRSDSRHMGGSMNSFMVHEFVPPAMNVFTVTSNSTASAATLSHYPRFHTHVAS